MKANELRIGNWVEQIEHKNSDSPFKKQIQFDESNWYRIGECIEFLEDYHPIPLTEEWLVRFGAKVWKNNTYIPYDLGSEQICLTEGKLWFYGNSGPIGQPLIYVHQLQNLYFALTGEELCVKS